MTFVDFLNSWFTGNNLALLGADGPDLDALCALADASPSHLSRLIKKETGQNFVDLLNSIRINKSIRLIRSGNYRLYEVANLVGIPNYAYFYQLFKKHIGIAPTDYLFQNKDEP